MLQYKDDNELITVLTWYEMCFAVGLNVGPGAPVIFSWVDLNIGEWRIDKYNALHVFIVLVAVLLFVLLWFQLGDLSKELDQLKIKY